MDASIMKPTLSMKMVFCILALVVLYLVVRYIFHIVS
nr:MAG TPA: hypothetical protein [Caudoviricetes sp.]